MTIDDIKKALEARKDRSAWSKGVNAYALELLEQLEEATAGGYFNPEQLEDLDAVKAAMLNGAKDWTEYSYGGSALIYDYDIASRLCSPSELRRTRNGERRPNAREDWLDTQARALTQAAGRIRAEIRAAAQR